MRKPQYHRLPSVDTRQRAVLMVCLLATGLVLLSAAQAVSADGGGWPTPSPTFVLFPTPTVTTLPTTEPYPYPKTLPTQMQLQAPLPSPTFLLPTAMPVASSGSTFVCWPFALALLLVIILGSTVIFRRVRT